MKKSKLVTLLSSFSKDEMKRFGKFISSPYFNNERNFKPVFTILNKYHPDFETDHLTEKSLFTKLYPSKEFNSRSALSIRVLFSQLFVLAEKFLAVEGFNKNQTFQDCCLLRELHLKKMLDIFLSAKSRIKKDIDTDILGNSNPLNTFLVFNEITGWTKYRNSKDEAMRFDDFNIAENALINFFLLNITEINQRWNKDYDKNSVRSELSNTFFKFFDIEKFMEDLKKSKDFNSVLIQIIYYSHKIEADVNYEEGYDILSKIFFDNFYNMTIGMKNELLIRLMNFCIFQFKGNRIKYNEDYIQYYLLQINENLNDMHHEVFGIRQIRNFVRICCRLKKYNVIGNFLREYNTQISIDIRPDCINYANASIEFSRKKFKETLEILSKINFSIPMMVKDIKMLKLKCFYELNYYDSLKSEIDTYRHYLSTAVSIPKDYAASDKKFMIYLVKLSKIRESNRTDEFLSLKKELEGSVLNDNTKWILEKIEDLLLISYTEKPMKKIKYS